jgi:GT2 family glycosyltransferase
VPEPVTVAVVTRTRDRPLLLDRAVRSVMQQTFSDLSMVIVNDGGDPGAVEALVEAHRGRVQGRAVVVHHETSRGMEAATNAGLAATDSRFVAVLDDDDTWHPRFLECTVDTLERTGAAGVVTDTQAVYEDTDYGDIRFLESFPFDPMADVAPVAPPAVPGRRLPPTSLFRLLSGNQFPPCSFVYRREALDEVGGYDESLPVLGDWDFNLRFQRRYDVEYLDVPLAYYHHRKGESGEPGNSVSHPEQLHDRVRTQLLNRYLRRDLDDRVAGVGVLANALHHSRVQRADDLAALAALTARLDSIDQALGELADRLEGLAGPAGRRSGDTPVPEVSGEQPEPVGSPARPVVDLVRRKLLGGSRPPAPTSIGAPAPGEVPG